MIAVDTNILVYAHRAEAPWHDLSLDRLTGLASSGQPWAIPWACVHEFLSIVTRRPFTPPSTRKQAFGAIEAWLDSGTLSFIGESDDHLARLRSLATTARTAGGGYHDARIAAICLAHGVSELWTADRDFAHYSDLRAVNPLRA